MADSSKYVDLTGLGTFLTELKSKYASNSSTSFAVKYAEGADKLNTARNFSIAGDATATAVAFDGQGDVTLNVTIADATSSTKGLMTATQVASLEELVGLKPAEAGAQVNKIEAIALKNNGDADFADLSIVGKKVSIDLSSYAKLSDIASGINFKGSVATKTDLPASANAGDVYFCKDTNAEYIWVPADTGKGVEAHFEEFGNVIALDGYYTKGEVDGLVNGAKTELQGNIDKKVDKVAGKSLVDDTAIAKLTGGAVADGNNGFVSGAQVFGAIGALDYNDGVAGDFVTGVKQANGVVSNTKASFATVISASAYGDNEGGIAPTAKAVKTYVDGAISSNITTATEAEIKGLFA